MRQVAVIDMGTNTFNLLVAKVGDGTHEVLLNAKRAVGLGRGGITKGFITHEAIDRALSTLHAFKQTCDQYMVDQVLITGTSAVRSAKNQADFLKRINDELGWKVKVLSGDEEALGIFQGVKAALTIPEDNSLIVDIGGGSVEFILCKAQEGVLWKHSFEIGGQRLMDLFHTSDPIKQEHIHNIRLFLDEQLNKLLEAVKKFKGVKTLIGSSGSFDTLCEMYCAEVKEILKPGISNFTLPIEAYKKLSEKIVSKNREERLAIPGMITLRVDMIVVALVLIDWLIEKLEIENLYVSFFSLKEGLLKTL